jgi:hypothetical protein
VPLAGVLLCVVSTAGGQQAAAQPRADCRTAGSTIDAGPGGRVYLRPTREADRVYLCSYRTGRRTAIGWDDCFDAAGVVEVAFTRRFVALGLWSCAPGGTSATVELRNTASGRRVRRILRPGGDDPGELEYVTDLVVRRNGALAWIIELRDSADSPARYQVRSSPGGTSSTILAEGSDIAAGSLALAGSTLYWTQGGLPRSASL